MKNKNRGFTLIELMVVMTIIGVLAGFALVSFQGARKTARDGKRKADLEQIRGALEMRRADCGSYPSGIIISGSDILGTDVSPGCQVCCRTTNYMTIPSDPIPSDRRYIYNGLANSYALCAAVEVGGVVVGGCGAGGCTVACNLKMTQP